MLKALSSAESLVAANWLNLLSFMEDYFEYIQFLSLLDLYKNARQSASNPLQNRLNLFKLRWICTVILLTLVDNFPTNYRHHCLYIFYGLLWAGQYIIGDDNQVCQLTWLDRPLHILLK